MEQKRSRSCKEKKAQGENQMFSGTFFFKECCQQWKWQSFLSSKKQELLNMLGKWKESSDSVCCITDNVWSTTLVREKDFKDLEDWHEGEKERKAGQFVPLTRHCEMAQAESKEGFSFSVSRTEEKQFVLREWRAVKRVYKRISALRKHLTK